jgi:hypothetical protein
MSMKVALCTSCGRQRVTFRLTGGRGRRAIRAHKHAGSLCAGSWLHVHPHQLRDL